MIEHGVLFHRTPDNATEQKKAASVLKYWVIGWVLIVRKKIDTALRPVPTFVTAHTFCASRVTRVSYGLCLLIQGYFCMV